MKKKRESVFGSARTNRRSRAQLNFQILKILARDVVGNMLIADLHEIFRRKSLSDAITQRPSFLYVYLHRLAQRGIVRIEGLRRRKTVTLTAKGEKEIRRIESEHARTIPIGIGLPRRPCGIFRNLHSVDVKAEKCSSRRSAVEQLSKQGELFYFSYDLPAESKGDRNLLRTALHRAGAVMLHESFYVLRENLPQVIALTESAGLLPFVAWGRINPMST